MKLEKVIGIGGQHDNFELDNVSLEDFHSTNKKPVDGVTRTLIKALSITV